MTKLTWLGGTSDGFRFFAVGQLQVAETIASNYRDRSNR
jgi:hypothetical protein